MWWGHAAQAAAVCYQAAVWPCRRTMLQGVEAHALGPGTPPAPGRQSTNPPPFLPPPPLPPRPSPPPVTEEAAPHHAVGQQADAVGSAELRHAILRAAVQQAVLHLVEAGGRVGAWVGGEEGTQRQCRRIESGTCVLCQVCGLLLPLASPPAFAWPLPPSFPYPVPTPHRHLDHPAASSPNLSHLRPCTHPASPDPPPPSSPGGWPGAPRHQ